MGIFSKVRDASDRITSDTIERARARASRLDTPALIDWIQTAEMNLGHCIFTGLREGESTAIDEALVLTESLHGMLMVLAERSTH